MQLLIVSIHFLFSTYKTKIITEVLGNYFTPAQTRALMKEKRVRWGVKDISQGLAIRTLSRRAFQYIRRNKIFPLPALSTLRKWIHKFQTEPGVQKPILQLMEEQLKANPTPGCCVASLGFDEMDIAKGYQYDAKQDQILGPFKKLQMAVLRGITSNWKQQVFYGFDQPMTAELLLSIILAIEKHGILVFDVVCDLGNQGLVSALDVSDSKPFFENPFCPSRRVYFFPDAPHLLKRLRDHLLDHGYTLADGTEINKEDLQKILMMDDKELKIHPKLSPLHFNCVNSTRQRVRLAAELISHTTASAVRCLLPNKGPLADWIEMFDQWFDIFNSRIPCHKKKMACGFGIHLEEQNAVLEKVFSCVESMRQKGRRSLLPFQKGLLISIRALQGLYQDLSTNHQVKFILTARLNQDSVENTFSKIRGIGSSHPGPLDCKNRLRLILLGKNGTWIVEQPSVAMEMPESEPEEVFDNSALVMKKAVAAVHPEPI